MRVATLALLLCLTALPGLGQAKADPEIEQEVFRIRAIDNHSHPPRVVRSGETDDEFDALPCDPLEPAPTPQKVRPDNPQFIAAWKALYAYPYDDASPAHVRELLASKRRVRAEQGDHFPVWVLDRLGIETELANRIAMGTGLVEPRFRWVPFDDALLLPLDTGILQDTPDRKFFYGREQKLLQRYMSEAQVSSLPSTLDEYLSRVVTPTLERQKKNGAVAIKFEAAYLRALDFGPASHEDAARVYAQHVGGSSPSPADYKIVQDFLFRYLAREAGRLGMPVHLHTGAGCRRPQLARAKQKAGGFRWLC